MLPPQPLFSVPGERRGPRAGVPTTVFALGHTRTPGAGVPAGREGRMEWGVLGDGDPGLVDEEENEIDGEVIAFRCCGCCGALRQYCADCYGGDRCLFGHCLTVVMVLVAQMVINVAFCVVILLVNVATRFPRDEEYAEGRFRADQEWSLLIALIVLWFFDAAMWVVGMRFRRKVTSSYTLIVLLGIFLAVTIAVMCLGMSNRNITRAFELEMLQRRMAPRCLTSAERGSDDCDFIRSGFLAARALLSAIMVAFGVAMLGVAPAFAAIAIYQTAKGKTIVLF